MTCYKLGSKIFIIKFKLGRLKPNKTILQPNFMKTDELILRTLRATPTPSKIESHKINKQLPNPFAI